MTKVGKHNWKATWDSKCDAGLEFLFSSRHFVYTRALFIKKNNKTSAKRSRRGSGFCFTCTISSFRKQPSGEKRVLKGALPFLFQLKHGGGKASCIRAGSRAVVRRLSWHPDGSPSSKAFWKKWQLLLPRIMWYFPKFYRMWSNFFKVVFFSL